MRLSHFIGVLTIPAALAGCAGNELESAMDRTWGGERVEIEPTTWVDPDGCEHWVFDTGAEGYMTPKFRPDGTAICSGDPSVTTEGALAFGTITRSGASASDFVMTVDANFAVDSATLSASAYRDLDAFTAYLNERGINRVRVEGHTDSTGSDDYNLDLSVRRAAAVADYIERAGIVAQSVGVGEAFPIASNETEAGRAANRRVQITILQ
ncbi:MAG: OmpA family protein [Rubricella sp.]